MYIICVYIYIHYILYNYTLYNINIYIFAATKQIQQVSMVLKIAINTNYDHFWKKQNETKKGQKKYHLRPLLSL